MGSHAAVQEYEEKKKQKEKQDEKERLRAEREVMFEKVCKRMQAAAYTAGGKDWEKLFREQDKDHSGEISWDEFYSMCRRVLKLKDDEKDLRSVFKFCDEDGSGEVSIAELIALVKKYDHTKEEEGAEGDEKVITHEMKEKKKERKQLLKKTVQRMQAAAYTSGGKDWEKLFREQDKDHSGEIDWTEFYSMCRRVLKLKDPEKDLKAVFKYLDGDGSGEVSIEELVEFVKKECEDTEESHSGNCKNWMGGLRQRVGDGAAGSGIKFVKPHKGNVRSPWETSAETRAKRAQEARDALMERVCTRMKAAAYTTGGKNWTKLFREQDKDHSGEIDWDEFYSMCRRVLKLKEDESDLKTVFNCLDEDDSGQVSIDELVLLVKQWDKTKKDKNGKRRDSVEQVEVVIKKKITRPKVNPEEPQTPVAHFRNELRHRYQTLVRAWRIVFDRRSLGRTTFIDFSSAVFGLRLGLNSRERAQLWDDLMGMNGAKRDNLTLDDFDPASAVVMQEFAKACWKRLGIMGSVDDVWARCFDLQSRGGIRLMDFTAECRSIGFDGDARWTFLSLDLEGLGFLTRADFSYLDAFSPKRRPAAWPDHEIMSLFLGWLRENFGGTAQACESLRVTSHLSVTLYDFSRWLREYGFRGDWERLSGILDTNGVGYLTSTSFEPLRELEAQLAPVVAMTPRATAQETLPEAEENFKRWANSRGWSKLRQFIPAGSDVEVSFFINQVRTLGYKGDRERLAVLLQRDHPATTTISRRDLIMIEKRLHGPRVFLTSPVVKKKKLVTPRTKTAKDDLQDLIRKTCSKMKAAAYTNGGKDWHKLFHEQDKDHSGQISWEEFYSMCRRVLKLTDDEEHLRALFRSMDKDGSGEDGFGEVSIDELVEWIKEKSAEPASDDGSPSPPSSARPAWDDTVTDLSLINEDRSSASKKYFGEHSMQLERHLKKITKQKSKEAIEQTLDRVKIKLKAAAYTKGGKDWAKLFRQQDKDKSGEISWEEFYSMCRRVLKLTEDEKDLRRVFNQLDVDGSGEVSIDELIELISKEKDEDVASSRSSGKKPKQQSASPGRPTWDDTVVDSSILNEDRPQATRSYFSPAKRWTQSPGTNSDQ